MTMLLTRAPGSPPVALCTDADCLIGWLTVAAGHRLSAIIPVRDGPDWCVHCHICGTHLWAPQRCDLHDPDGCPARRWELTHAAKRYLAALVALLPTEDLPDDALEQAERLADDGIGPGRAAHLILGLPEL